MSIAAVAIDWTFRVSDILAVLGFAGGGIGGALILTRTVDRLSLRMNTLEDKLDQSTAETTKKIDAQSTEIARVAELMNLYVRFDERLASQQRQIDDLKRGRGYIVEDSPHVPRGRT